MKIAIVSSKDLGTNCWLPKRFVGECHKCDRFVVCNYPEKKVSLEAQAVIEEIKGLEKDARGKLNRANKLREQHNMKGVRLTKEKKK